MQGGEVDGSEVGVELPRIVMGSLPSFFEADVEEGEEGEEGEEEGEEDEEGGEEDEEDDEIEAEIDAEEGFFQQVLEEEEAAVEAEASRWRRRRGQLLRRDPRLSQMRDAAKEAMREARAAEDAVQREWREVEREAWGGERMRTVRDECTRKRRRATASERRLEARVEAAIGPAPPSEPTLQTLTERLARTVHRRLLDAGGEGGSYRGAGNESGIRFRG